MKRLVLSIGIEDAEPNSPNTFFKSLTLEQGKAILAALDETARKGEGALKELVAEPTLAAQHGLTENLGVLRERVS